jgi:hypothetical protein
MGTVFRMEAVGGSIFYYKPNVDKNYAKTQQHAEFLLGEKLDRGTG